MDSGSWNYSLCQYASTRFRRICSLLESGICLVLDLRNHSLHHVGMTSSSSYRQRAMRPRLSQLCSGPILLITYMLKKGPSFLSGTSFFSFLSGLKVFAAVVPLEEVFLLYEDVSADGFPLSPPSAAGAPTTCLHHLLLHSTLSQRSGNRQPNRYVPYTDTSHLRLRFFIHVSGVCDVVRIRVSHSIPSRHLPGVTPSS